MSTADYLGTYAEGWGSGDSGIILSAASESFVFDDPNAGKIAKADFAAYFDGLTELVASIRGSDYDGPFMELTEVVTKEDDGVLSERIAYYSKLPG
jgi:hypothetical protein